MVKTPLLMTQNEKDQRAPLTQAIEFYRAVELTNTPVRLFIYPDEPHGPMIKPMHILDKLQKMEGWFERYLK
jgi:dipeptidyl aminopeptidase/acylaminoacyl peptidase